MFSIDIVLYAELVVPCRETIGSINGCIACIMIMMDLEMDSHIISFVYLLILVLIPQTTRKGVFCWTVQCCYINTFTQKSIA